MSMEIKFQIIFKLSFFHKYCHIFLKMVLDASESEALETVLTQLNMYQKTWLAGQF
jgi:hypothetical protein